MARPRVFDLEKAVQTATVMFWKKGYEQTSVAALTRDMAIIPPSFYFAEGESLVRSGTVSCM
jgi:hypothetical protein